MQQLCKDRVVIITGAGRGLGREYALEFARQGAKVVVNDLGGHGDGSGAASGPALDVVAEIEALGGHAVANFDDVADWNGARRMIDTAISAFGGLDVLVNNAGILRDRTLANMSEEDWDAVIRVHLRATPPPTGATRQRRVARGWRGSSIRVRRRGCTAIRARPTMARRRRASRRCR
jgi:NAD(P)-dependent dehydrogenase (short-subunit alcohol dehydrogenase family)